MRLQQQFLRAAGTFALWAGYGAGRARRAWHLAALSLLWRTRWRKLQVRDLKLRVPADWGDVEEAPDGGLVIHNRPKRYRIDGDAIWYSTAVELRIRPAESQALPRLAPMQETCRTIPTAEGPVVVALAIANGVGPRKRREAHRVFASVHRRRTRHWPGWLTSA